MAIASREKPRTNPYLPPFDPGTYRAKASDWVGYAQKFPELWGFKTFDEFNAWRGKEHPEIPSTAWDNRDYYQEYYAQFPEERKSEHELAQHYYEYEKQEAAEAEQQRQQEKAEQQHRMMETKEYLPKGYEAINKATGKITGIFKSPPLAATMYLDKDFVKIVDKIRADYQNTHPTDKTFATTPTFKVDSSGRAVLNPDILAKIPDLYIRTENQFREKRADRAAQYDQKRGVTLENGVHHEALLQQNLATIEQQLKQDIWRNRDSRRFRSDIQQIDPEVRRRELALQVLGPYAQQYPEQAKALERNNPLLHYALLPESQRAVVETIHQRQAQARATIIEEQRKKETVVSGAQRQAISQPAMPKIIPADQAQKDVNDLDYTNKYIAAETEREIQRRIVEIKAGPFSPVEQENRIRSLQTRRGEIETEIRQREFTRFVEEDIARAGRLFHGNPDIREASTIHNAEIPEAKRRKKYGRPTANVEEIAKTLQEKAVQQGKAKYDQKTKEYEVLALGGYSIPKPVLGDFINTERSALDHEFVIANPLLARELAEKQGRTAPWLTTAYSSWRGEIREGPTERQFAPESPLQHRSDIFLNKFHQDAFTQAKASFDQALAAYAAAHGNALPLHEYQRILWHGGQYQEIHEDGKVRVRMVREGDHPENTTASAEHEEDYEEHGEKKKRKVKTFSQTGFLNDALQAQMLTLFLTDPTRFAMYSEKDPFFKSFATTLHELDRNFAEAQNRANSEFQLAAKQYMAKRVGQPPSKSALLNRMLLELDKQFAQRHPRMARFLATADNVDHQYKKRLQKALGLPLELPKQIATPSIAKGQRATTPSYTQQMTEHIASYGGTQPLPSSAPHPSSPRAYGRGARIPRPRLPRRTIGRPLDRIPGLPSMPGGGLTRTAAQATRLVRMIAVLIPAVKILLIFLVIVLIFAIAYSFFDLLIPGGGGGTGSVEKTTDDLERDNPSSQQAADIQTIQENGQAVAGASTSSVLAANDNNFLNPLFDLLVNPNTPFEDIERNLTELGLAIDKSKITYTIRASYDGVADDIIVTDPIPCNALFLKASGKYTTKRGKFGSCPGLEKYADVEKVTEVVWSVKENQGISGGGTGGPIATTFNQAKFASYGFPPPQNPNPVVLSGETLQRWNQYVKGHAIKAAQATGVDAGIIGMWPFLEGSFIPFDNCDQEHNVSSAGDNNHNTQCYLWGDYWQVGLGLHPAYTIDFIADAFDTMYGFHDAATVQRVGQQVIQNMKTRYGTTLSIVSSFPSTPLEQIISGSKNGNFPMRNLLTTLMKDEAIGTYLIARHFKDNIGIDSGMASQMEGWSSTYYNRQKIVNYIKAIYDAEKSPAPTQQAGTGSNFSLSQPIDMTRVLGSQTADPQKGVLAACDTGSLYCGPNCSVATEKSSDGMYETTGFGCYIDSNGNRNNSDTPGCIAFCGNPPGECNGLNEVDCMYKLKWFAANSDQFGCHNRLRVTNPQNGKSVVVVVYDRGPNCRVMPRGPVLDLSYPAAFYLGVGNYEKVKVEAVSNATRLGPTDGSSSLPPDSSGTTGTSGTTGGTATFAPQEFTNTILPLVKDTLFESSQARAEIINGRGTGGTPVGDNSNSSTSSPPNPNATCPGKGPITCGTLAGGCHCSESYQASVTSCNGSCPWCQPPDDSSKWAIDIANAEDAPIYIPKISVGGQAHTVTCKGYGNQPGSIEPNQVILIVSCSDDTTDEAVWMQFHHSKGSNPLEISKFYKTGDVVGYTGKMEVFDAGEHVHFQIGVGGPCGADTSGCRNADELVQCNG